MVFAFKIGGNFGRLLAQPHGTFTPPHADGEAHNAVMRSMREYHYTDMKVIAHALPARFAAWLYRSFPAEVVAHLPSGSFHTECVRIALYTAP